jgi:predicted metal-dependent HD superfamily phosphohydrolase
MNQAMRDRWDSLCERVGVFKKADESDLTFEMLSTLYAHPVRAYHNLDHIAQLLEEFDLAAKLASDRDMAEFSIWLHDCVYYPLRGDNEERSADAAGTIAGLLGCKPGFVAQVRDCIMATRHSQSPGRGDTALVADIDLTILAANQGVYDRYRAAIREEFSFAPDELFFAGRRAFVQRMLDKERIFATEFFYKELENKAKNNLYRELDELERRSATR